MQTFNDKSVCKHGLTLGTCAYCSGAVTKPTEIGPGLGAFTLSDAGYAAFNAFRGSLSRNDEYDRGNSRSAE